MGAAAEEQARQWFEARGYITLASNWRYGRGEIDLIFKDAEQKIIFVEVKHRPFNWPVNECFPGPKQIRTLMETATAFMRKHPGFHSARFDFILIRGKGENAQLEHFEGAIG